jgi:spermidine/putrescine-binding protein
VVDFLIEKKKEGQFRVLWTSFEQAVNLMVNKEVKVLDGWEPMVIAAKKQGINAVYATPKEGYLLWAMSGYITNNPDRSPEQTQAIYDLFDFMLGPWYGAKISAMRGYMTNSQAPGYAEAHPDEFEPGEADAAVANDANVKRKVEFGGIWHNRWPTYYMEHESAWARFKAA